MSNFEIFSIRLKELRTSMNLTQKQFAEIVGTTSVTISAYENNAKKPSLDIVKDIAEKCNVSLDWLCGLSDKKKSDNELETYSDIVEFLFRIKEKCECFDLDIVDATRRNQGIKKDTKAVSFGNKKINEFIGDWIKILSANGIFDDTELYDLWKEKTLKKYNVPIKEDDLDDIYGLGSLPFD